MDSGGLSNQLLSVNSLTRQYVTSLRNVMPNSPSLYITYKKLLRENANAGSLKRSNWELIYSRETFLESFQSH